MTRLRQSASFIASRLGEADAVLAMPQAARALVASRPEPEDLSPPIRVTLPIADPDPSLRPRLAAEWQHEMDEPFHSVPNTELTRRLRAEWSQAMGELT